MMHVEHCGTWETRMGGGGGGCLFMNGIIESYPQVSIAIQPWIQLLSAFIPSMAAEE